MSIAARSSRDATRISASWRAASATAACRTAATRRADLPQAGEPVYNRAEWRRSAAQTKGGNLLPDVVVLEGPNEYIKDEEDKFSPHGYAVLNFDGPSLTEQVLNPKGQVIYEKKLV